MIVLLKIVSENQIYIMLKTYQKPCNSITARFIDNLQMHN